MGLSESMLFTTLFLAAYHTVLSQGLIPGESLEIPEPLELAYGAALLLSHAGVLVGMVYVGRASMGVFYWCLYCALVYTLGFLVIQVSEFSVLGVYINDSYIGTTYITISGLHFVHVLYGILIVASGSGAGCCVDISPVDTIPIMVYSYWHLVELVYVCIYISLYY